MHHQKVISDHVASVGYDPVNRVLEVEFQNGYRYQYRGVPSDEHQRLMACPSTGQYLHHNIKGAYDCERVK